MLPGRQTTYKETEQAAFKKAEKHQQAKQKWGYSQGQAVRNALQWGLAQPAAQAILPVQAGIHEVSKHVIPGYRGLSAAMQMYGNVEDKAVTSLSDATNVDPMVWRGVEAAATLPFVHKQAGKLATKIPGVNQARGLWSLRRGIPEAGTGIQTGYPLHVELSDYLTEGVLIKGGSLEKAFNTLNPKKHKLFTSKIAKPLSELYNEYKLLGATLLKSKSNPDGMKPKEFLEKYGIFPAISAGAPTLRMPKSQDRQDAQREGVGNRLERARPPSEEELTPLFEELGIPLELRKKYITYAKTGFRRVQEISSELSKQTGILYHAGHPFPLKFWGDVLKEGVNRIQMSPTGGSATPELARGKGGEPLGHGLKRQPGNLNKGDREGAVNVHAARIAGIPATWEDDVALWWARKNNLPLPDWKADWTNHQRELILAIPENWQLPKVEVMMEVIAKEGHKRHWTLKDVMREAAEIEKGEAIEWWETLKDKQ